VDIRRLPGYQEAKTTRTLAVTEPAINPDTGFPILSLRVPIYHGVDFIGCASANITMDVLSRFLDGHRASARSTTLIADRNTGKIIAFPSKQKGVRVENGHILIATLADIDDPDVREARRQHAGTDTDNFVFQSPINGEDLIAAFANFPDSFGQPWQVITLTPVDDFVGTLKATNRLIMIASISPGIELFFIFSRPGGSQPVENVSSNAGVEPAIRRAVSRHPTFARLQGLIRSCAASKLAEIVPSFKAAGYVRQLIKSGIRCPGCRPRSSPCSFRLRIFPRTPKHWRRTICWCRSRPISSKFPERYRKKAEPSTSSSAMA
jgi:hypothetical protein